MEHVSDLDVPRIIDYVCILSKPCFSRSADPIDGEIVPFERAKIEHRFPQVNHADIEFPGEVLDLFCFPSSDPCALTPAPHPFFSTFILTDASGHRTYVSSLQWLAREHNNSTLSYKSLCLVGRIPLYSLHEAVLIQTFALLSVDSTMEASQQNVPIALPERLINYLIHAAPVPGNKEVISVDLGSHRFYYGLGLATDPSNGSGNLNNNNSNSKNIDDGDRPNHNISLPHVDDAMFNVLFHVMSPDTIVAVVEMLLQERRVLFHSSKVYRLTAVCEAVASLLFPFDWSHVFIPVLPHDLLHYLEAPMPYIIGVHSSCIGSPDWQDLSTEQLPTVIVDIDHDTVERNPPWMAPMETSAPNRPRPPPTGFTKRMHEVLNKSLYRLTPSSKAHGDLGHLHETSNRPHYRSPVTGLRYEFNPKRSKRWPVPAKEKVNVTSPVPSPYASTPLASSSSTTTTPPSTTPSSTTPSSTTPLPTTPSTSPAGGGGGEIASMFVQGIHTEKTILCGGTHHRWIDQARVAFLRTVVSLLVSPGWDIRRHVDDTTDTHNTTHHFHRNRGPPPFDEKIFLSKITDNTIKPLVRKLLKTQMFVQFMGSLRSTKPSTEYINKKSLQKDLAYHSLVRGSNKRGRSETTAEVQTAGEVHSSVDLLSEQRNQERGVAFKNGQGGGQDSNESDEGDAHVHLWSILHIAVELNKTGIMGPPEQRPLSNRPIYGPLPVAIPPPPPRTPRGARSARPQPPRPPPLVGMNGTVVNSAIVQPRPSRPPQPSQPPRPPRPPHTPTSSRPPPHTPTGSRPPPQSRLEKTTDNSNDANDANDNNRKTYNDLINKLCRSSDPKHPVRIFQENDQHGVEVDEKNGMTRNGITLLQVPAAPSQVINMSEAEEFQTHTCLWGHYKLRNLMTSLYGSIPVIAEEEERKHTSKAGVDGTKMKGDSTNEERDTFDENILSPSGNNRRTLRKKNSFRQKSKINQNAMNNNKKQRRGKPGRPMQARRHSTFAAVGTNDLAYLGVTAGRFAEIQSSIWSQVLPTMGKVTSKRIRGRRRSIIGGNSNLGGKGNGGSQKTGGRSFAGVSVLQKMMAKHAAEAKSDQAANALQTPGKRLGRGGSIQNLVGKKTTLSILNNGRGLVTPLRSNVGGSGGTKGKFGRTPAKSTVKRSNIGAGRELKLGHHNKSSSTMSALNWGDAIVSPSMNHLLQTRLYNLSMVNVRALGNERLALKKRLAELEATMKQATVTAMVRNYQLKKAKGGSKSYVDQKTVAKTNSRALGKNAEEGGNSNSDDDDEVVTLTEFVF